MRCQPALALALLMGLSLACAAHAATPAPAAPDKPEVSDALRSGDIAQAFRSTKELAEQGGLEQQHNLSLFYWHGVGIPQNFEEALRWSTLAAVRGHRKAVAARSIMMRNLDSQLAQKSMQWTRERLIKLAEAGDDLALPPLAVSFRPDFGFGNDVEAYFWSTLAVSAGKVEVRRQRDALVPTMKQADILKAQQRASEWMGRWRKERS